MPQKNCQVISSGLSILTKSHPILLKNQFVKVEQWSSKKKMRGIKHQTIKYLQFHSYVERISNNIQFPRSNF